MSKRYGLPYKGSKNSIAEKIINFLPEAECFVDLFAGGDLYDLYWELSHKWFREVKA